MDLDADRAWAVVAGAGPGDHWYVDALPLVLRGAVDRALGGEGRRWPVPPGAQLDVGDTAGFWRVVRASRRTLELDADVRAPGRVTLETRIEPDGDRSCTVRQAVTFEPGGLAGQLYMLIDLPARELVAELVHRAVLAELDRAG